MADDSLTFRSRVFVYNATDSPCTKEITGEDWNHTAQRVYRCDTCALDDVCHPCMVQCHQSHRVSNERHAAQRFCDCLMASTLECAAGRPTLSSYIFNGRRVAYQSSTSGCSIATTGANWRNTAQLMYRCESCDLNDVCHSCVNQCHVAHRLSEKRPAADRYCDCADGCSAANTRFYDAFGNHLRAEVALATLRMLQTFGVPKEIRQKIFALASQRLFPVHVKALTGKCITLSLSALHLGDDVKAEIERVEGTPKATQRLIHAGKPLDDAFVLAHYGVGAHSTIHLVLRLD